MKKRSWFSFRNPKVAVQNEHSNVTWISMKKLYSSTGSSQAIAVSYQPVAYNGYNIPDLK
jgi:hypothetical protein